MDNCNQLNINCLCDRSPPSPANKHLLFNLICFPSSNCFSQHRRSAPFPRRPIGLAGPIGKRLFFLHARLEPQPALFAGRFLLGWGHWTARRHALEARARSGPAFASFILSLSCRTTLRIFLLWDPSPLVGCLSFVPLSCFRTRERTLVPLPVVNFCLDRTGDYQILLQYSHSLTASRKQISNPFTPEYPRSRDNCKCASTTPLSHRKTRSRPVQTLPQRSPR